MPRRGERRRRLDLTGQHPRVGLHRPQRRGHAAAEAAAAEGHQHRIDVGQILCDIETDKAVIEYESPAAGRLSRIVAEADQTIEVKQPIAYLGNDDQALDAYLAAAADGTVTTATATPTAPEPTSAATASPQPF